MPTYIEPQRDYKFSDGRLIEISLEKIAVARRDAVELLTLGITEEWVDDLEEQVMAFAAMPTDTVELGEQKEATDIKEVEEGELLDKLKELRSAAKRALGEKSSSYGKFGFHDLSKFTDGDLVKLSLVLPALTTKHAVVLATKGWDAADNTALQGMLTDFVTGLQNQKLEEDSRDTATENRITEGNDLYDKVENDLCEAGKAYWRTISEAKYNDYIIYNTSSGTNSISVEGDLISPGTVLIPKPDDVTYSASLEIKVEITGNDPGGARAYFAGFEGNPPAPNQPFMDVQVGQEDTGEAGADMGYDAVNRTLFQLQNIGMVTVHYKVTFYL